MSGRDWLGPAVVFAMAVVLAVAANLVVFLLATEVLSQPLLMPAESPPPELAPLGMVDVALFSLVVGIGAVVVYAIIGARSAKPLQVFVFVAGAVLVASLLLPARIPSPPVDEAAKLILAAMHVVGYAVIVATLWLGEAHGWLGLGRQK